LLSEPILHFDTDPGNIGVRITVHNEVDGSTTDLLFKQFPVRIGRNKLNDLVLGHQYVSNWHAIIGFVRSQLTLVQVGSSNSVVVGDRRLVPNEDVPLGDGESIRIVPFTLYVKLMPMPGRHVQPQNPMMESASAAGSTPSEVERIAFQALDQLSRRFAGKRLETAKQTAEFAVNVEQVLDIFLRCFVALQKGQEQFRAALDIKALGHAESVLDSAQDSLGLAALLFSSHNPHALRALEHAFKNIMIHQIALLNGLMAGIRTLLAKLSPERVMKQTKKSRPSWRQLWEAYVEMHADLAEEDNEAFETIFGKQFSKAYATLVGGRGSSQP
jgi:predicted component of type VI protein secretion system